MSQIIVTIRATVTKEITCENCTLLEARENPFDYAVYEQELEQVDWEVISVKEDK